MNAAVFLEHTFLRDRDGRVYSQQGLDASFWQRYLEVFAPLSVVSRVRDVDELPAGVVRTDAPGVTFAALPPYVGPRAFARQIAALRQIASQAVDDADAVILRVPGPIATLGWSRLRRTRRPFAVEVVGDPWESLAPGGVRSRFRPFARCWMWWSQRRQCAAAAAALYVTREALQRRYPPGRPENAVACSDVALSPADFVARPRTRFERRLILVGTLEVLYKGPHILAEALARLRRLDLHLTYVGDGRRRADIEALVRRLGIGHQVMFTGRMPREGVRDALDAADLFVLPSLTEGLPRALLEAMARGLPCIGSAVGGIPELLDEESLVPPGDPAALAARIAELVDDPARMARTSQRNLSVAAEYRPEKLGQRRLEFYRRVAELCASGART
ncbi:MAG: D-inositol-3-phosphate glycosyltransferase [Phycisphaerae bacterium]|nr:D-inositol-3-phosphate glycosyltransferase [Phycisphaerae bacterium]